MTSIILLLKHNPELLPSHEISVFEQLHLAKGQSCNCELFTLLLRYPEPLPGHQISVLDIKRSAL